ncbi:multidrug/biocide efflux PACE transporter [Dickeya dianthicola]|uniref:Multidrug/biocide efflux PACE transporter n=1 Tax=Dickeya dianthicola TaxID=204039 RepID=A0ABX9NQ46_9GAMM|nr:multidrug/biocide efflux PACE transporter [Dickeya dianthicola]MCI4068141.1 multidrug/biocide efflux PACE transporter [Dickeya dianthicola]MCI4114141.1 multidrug/biocide efflux PACE transporter [Dickeya dianthicola]MCI4117987.1 multidrug/biocide efflux PACE transporter [Dickeya dianthicola]MCI4122401.1 multidrug/biocide efflux PACE transporter [Dickeya dianthicola]MCI4190273.1 multidrug/biocide efflux PACE transporter [Dickeya dianthicola]
MQPQIQQKARHEQKTFRERIAHAIGFEVMALLICAPVGAWVLGRSILQVGALSIMLSSVAMVWNVAYNGLFDRLWPVSRIRRGLWVRMGHALGFEGGFILIGLPLAAWMLNITLWQALMVEIGFFLFFLPYTMTYNWLYDLLRERLLATARISAS